jgi:hypothetical protein
MDQPDPPNPPDAARLTPQAERARLDRPPLDRKAREAAALRENLRRRRRQGQAREAEKAKDEPPCR